MFVALLKRNVLAGTRSGAAVALRKGKSNWLFDCGEDTQRQLLKQALVRPGKIDRFFVTRASGDSAFGLPGMHLYLTLLYRLYPLLELGQVAT